MPSIIVYYSRADENYFGGALRYIEKGNTQIAAEILQKLAGADIFKIEQLAPYSRDYNSCVEEARSDLHQNARPEIKAMPDSLDEYDTVYLGFPNYCGTMPMAMFTFLERAELAGKTIKPFCTNEGSGMGRSEGDIKALCPDSKVEKGLSIWGSRAADSEKDFKKWL